MLSRWPGHSAAQTVLLRSQRAWATPSAPLVRFLSSSPARLASPASPASPAPSASSFTRPAGAGGVRRIVREPVERDLPELKSRTPIYLAVALTAALAWAGFLAYATNAERANSSVVRSLVFQLRSWPAVKDFLGDGVKIEPVIGDLVRIKGSINMLAGRIDVQFRVRGSKAAGTASFTSIRRGKENRFEVLRWKVTRDDGAVLDLSGFNLESPLVDAVEGKA
ncbi:hypothetical protein JCM10207_002186 [Rhodosporidiobolus poonsookiae]